jgi:hypothetical protein
MEDLVLEVEHLSVPTALLLVTEDMEEVVAAVSAPPLLLVDLVETVP